MKELKYLLGLPLLKLGWAFLKIGIVFFGGGYVMIPAIQHEFVENLHWLNHQQFMDGIAISQLTPGPVAVLSTFTGYIIGNIPGALLATFCAFLPGCLLMLFFSKSYSWLSEEESARKVLDSLIPAIAGLLIGSAWILGGKAVTSLAGGALFVVALIALIRYKVNPIILIVVSACIGMIFGL